MKNKSLISRLVFIIRCRNVFFYSLGAGSHDFSKGNFHSSSSSQTTLSKSGNQGGMLSFLSQF